MAQKHFVQLKLGNKTFGPTKVSTEACSDVGDFKSAIKNNFPHLLGPNNGPLHLTLFQPDGITEIDPQTLVTDLNEVPWKPMVVTVEELPTQVPTGSSKKQSTYKRLSTEASCRTFLNAIAMELYFTYDFRKVYKRPTMDDVFAAKTANKEEWEILKSLNVDTTIRIPNSSLPQSQTSSWKRFVIIPHSKFTNEYASSLKRIAAIAGVVLEEDDLIVVKDESDLSKIVQALNLGQMMRS